MSVNGIRLAYLDAGDPEAAPLVLLHGLGERAASWEPVFSRFAGRHRVLAFDLRGHGDSDRPGEYSFRLMRDDVLAALDVLGLRDVILVGHSMGGAVAYLAAMAAPVRVDRLVVEDAPPPYARSRPLPERPEGPLDFDWAVVPAIHGEVGRHDAAAWDGLATITAPTLLVGGGPDSHVPQSRLRDVAGRIPDCTLVTIPAGHHVHETRPAEFAEVVLDWLGRT